MFDILVVCTEVAQRLDQFFSRVFFAAVKALELCLDFGFAGKKNLQSKTRAQANAVLGFQIQWIRQNQRQDIVLQMNWNDVKGT